jgi:hypothetical protein
MADDSGTALISTQGRPRTRDMTPALLTHVATTWAMVGVIWTMQLLQYPLMAQVPASSFPRFEAAHQRRVSWVLGIFAPAEIVTAAWLFLFPGPIPSWMPLAGGILLAAIWVSTALVYGRIHTRLSTGFDAVEHRRLLVGNWARTAAWSIRGVLVLGMLAVV